MVLATIRQSQKPAGPALWLDITVWLKFSAMPVVISDASDEDMTSVVWSIYATGKKQLEVADFLVVTKVRKPWFGSRILLRLRSILRSLLRVSAGLGWAPTLRLSACVQFWRGLRVVAITLTARVKYIWQDHTEPTTVLCAAGNCATYPWW